ncbi:LOW QUALITY PROTEIN: MRN complex-interacting protein [Molossus nigricans]
MGEGGENQSAKAYGEGSDAYYRCHIQKLSLLQGHFRDVTQGKKKQPSENCWLKYLERGSKELGLEGGVCFNRWPSTKKEKTPPCNLDGQVSGDSEFTLETQKDHAGLAGKVKEGSSHEDRDTRKFTGPWVEPLCPAQQVRAKSSKWERLFLPPENSSHVDTERPTPLQRDPRASEAAQAEQGTPRAKTQRTGGLSRTPSTLQLPWATHTPMSGPKKPFRETLKQ